MHANKKRKTLTVKHSNRAKGKKRFKYSLCYGSWTHAASLTEIASVAKENGFTHLMINNDVSHSISELLEDNMKKISEKRLDSKRKKCSVEL